MNSLKKGEGVPLLNFEGSPGVPLLNFQGGSQGPEVLGLGVLVPLLHYAFSGQVTWMVITEFKSKHGKRSRSVVFKLR